MTIVIFVLRLTQIYFFFTKDQTLLMVEGVKSEKECFLSGTLPFLHCKCLRGSEPFSSAQVFCSCLLNSILELIHLLAFRRHAGTCF